MAAIDCKPQLKIVPKPYRCISWSWVNIFILKPNCLNHNLRANYKPFSLDFNSCVLTNQFLLSPQQSDCNTDFKKILLIRQNLTTLMYEKCQFQVLQDFQTEHMLMNNFMRPGIALFTQGAFLSGGLCGCSNTHASAQLPFRFLILKIKKAGMFLS